MSYYLRGWSSNLRVAVLDTTEVARHAQRVHRLVDGGLACRKRAEGGQAALGVRSSAALLLARIQTSAAALACMLKGKERVRATMSLSTREIARNGGIRAVVAESSRLGVIRGFADLTRNFDDDGVGVRLQHERFEEEDENVVEGDFRVSTVLTGHGAPIVDVVGIVLGDVSSELESLCERSLQIPSAASVWSSANDDGVVDASGGVFIQSLPGCPAEVVDEARRNLFEFARQQGGIDRAISAASTDLSVITRAVLPRAEFDSLKFYMPPIEGAVPGIFPLAFNCECGQNSTLVAMREQALSDGLESGTELAVCKYCSTRHIV